MEQAYIDRFEGDYAVIMVGAEQLPMDVLRHHLPRQSREGQWLRVEIVANQLVSAHIDTAATEAARQRIQEKLERLRRGDHLTDT